MDISGEREIPAPEEIAASCEANLPADGKQTEIAFFGGSFTAIPEEQMVRYLEAAYPFVQKGRAAGIRLSTRPDAIDMEIIGILRSYGVTAVELGAQSMDDHVLLLNGRGHDSDAVRKASRMIRESGLSLGLQMMIGMYGTEDPIQDALSTADSFIGMQPDTVRIYPTLVVDNTPLAELFRRGKYRPLDLEEAVSVCAELIERFRRNSIRVIRVGLHAEESLQRELLGGPFHPAFGELCESRIFRNEIEREIDGRQSAVIYCNPALLSQIKGQKKSNQIYFAEKGVRLEIVPDPSTTRIRIEGP